MKLVDVNVLLYAFREDAPHHVRYRDWLHATVNSGMPFAVPDYVLASTIRIATHPRIFSPPTPFEAIAEFVETLRAAPTCVCLSPGPRHFPIFLDLCRKAGAKGNLISDAWLAAIAVETGSEFVTTDRDFTRFPGLVCRHPLD